MTTQQALELAAQHFEALAVVLCKPVTEEYRQIGYEDADLMAGKMREAIEALTEPFDPLKHLSGWVKEHDNYWNLYGKEGFFTLSRWDSVSDKWRISWQNSMSLGDARLFYGEIKTAAFFHALCGALNIK